MEGIPHIVVARRPGHDFRVVRISRGFALGESVMREGGWLALDWWGNCFLRSFDGAVGHFRSTVEKDLFLVMLVLDGPIAPDRFVAFLRKEEYARFGYDPFSALAEGLFAFADDFYREQGEDRRGPGWQKNDGSADEQERRLIADAELHLARGASILVPCSTEVRELRTEIMRCTSGLSAAIRMRISLCSFTNAPHDLLTHFGPILCGWYTTSWPRSLREVIEDLPRPSQGDAHEV